LFDDYQIDIPKKWDGMWRILMFDIAERDRKLRDNLRYKISEVGMEKLQGSVYVFPYPIDDFVSKLYQRYPESTKHVLLVLARSIEGEEQLIEKFRIKKLI
jgi:CRISPR-associated endonuclease Cas2